MGIETVLLGASLAVGAANVIVQQNAANKAAYAQRQSNAIQQAGQEVQNRIARRRAAKEARLRQARIAASAAGSGVINSSGVAGASADITNTYQTGVAQQAGDVLTSQGITQQQQIKADALRKADTFGAWASLFEHGVNAANKWDVFNNSSGGSSHPVGGTSVDTSYQTPWYGPQ